MATSSATATWSIRSGTFPGARPSGETPIAEEIRVRAFRPDDLPGVVRLLGDVWPVWPITEEGFRHRLASLPPRARPQRLVAEQDGTIVAWGAAVHSFEGSRDDTAFTSISIRPHLRRRGLGSDFLQRALDYLRRGGVRRLLSEACEDDGREFLEHHGFVKTFERRLSALDPREIDSAEVSRARADAAAEGFEVVPFSTCPPEQIHAVDAEAAQDIPHDEPSTNMPFDEWLERHMRHPLRSLEGSFAVRHEGRIVAVTFLQLDPERGRAMTDMTGTLRAYRRRGLATLLKLCQADWLASQGVTRVTTENDETNRPMLCVNDRLGYRPFAAVYSYAREPL